MDLWSLFYILYYLLKRNKLFGRLILNVWILNENCEETHKASMVPHYVVLASLKTKADRLQVWGQSWLYNETLSWKARIEQNDLSF
jgi:hypothetical protein